jgi:hypothetical protein
MLEPLVHPQASFNLEVVFGIQSETWSNLQALSSSDGDGNLGGHEEALHETLALHTFYFVDILRQDETSRPPFEPCEKAILQAPP